MFERFTDRARRAVVVAQDESRQLNHNYIGTEHLLLGMLTVSDSRREPTGGLAPKMIEACGADQLKIREAVLAQLTPGTSAPSGHIPFTPRCKKTLELALREALQLGHNYIGTEHLLLALIREEEGIAATVLSEHGVTLERARKELITILNGEAKIQAKEKAAAQEEIVRSRKRQVRELVRWLAPNERLPDKQRQIAETFHLAALVMLEEIPDDSNELIFGLRKLLEAKDCFVRASMT